MKNLISLYYFKCNQIVLITLVIIPVFVLARDEITVRGEVKMWYSPIGIQCPHPYLDPHPGFTDVSLGNNVIDFAQAMSYIYSHVEVTGDEAVWTCLEWINEWEIDFDALTNMDITRLLGNVEINTVPTEPVDCNPTQIFISGNTDYEIEDLILSSFADGYSIELVLDIYSTSATPGLESFDVNSDLGLLNSGTYSLSLNINFYREGDFLFDDEIDSLIPVLQTIPGDFNNDQIVDILDVINLVNCILTEDNCPCTDLDGDGEVDILDVMALVDVILGE